MSRLSVTLSLLVIVVAPGCSEEEGGIPGAEVRYTESRSPCTERDPLRHLFWGDLHFHTRNSWDAYGYYLTVSPEQSYDFAQGGAVLLPPLDAQGKGTRQARLGRPLDFAAATDHSEFLGETRLCTTSGSPAYSSKSCTSFRAMDTPAVTAWGLQLIVPEGQKRIADICGADGKACRDEAGKVWQELRQAAEEADDKSAACSFVSFVGYEHTATPKATNMHRNVIFRNADVPDLPLSYYEAPGPVDLWTGLEQKCLEAGGACDVMVIPHNMNMSNGNMFTPSFAPSGTLTSEAEVARLHARMEPILELFQHKGDQEWSDGLSGVTGDKDPLAAFEKERRPPVTDCGEQPGWGGMNDMGCLSRWDFLRGILLTGLEEHDRLGFNPYQHGVIGSTDTHNGTPGNTWEQGWPGHVGISDDTAEERLGPGNTTHRGLVNNPGGLAAVWAVERSRDAIFEAMRRREVYATSGTRIRVRFFGGWGGIADGLCNDPDLVETGYRSGVPMGGVLPGRGGASAPRFVVQAEHDPGTTTRPGVPLQRAQIVKGWIDDAGVARYKIYDVAGDAQQGSVDGKTCKPDGKGFQSLCEVWQDPDFDPRLRAFYYARVLEAPTCRWSTWECLAIDPAQQPAGCSDPAVEKTIQERAWTSAIWYEP